MTYRQLIITSIVGGIICTIMLFSLVLLTGQTFGQRCAVKYEKESADWKQCVSDLAEGKIRG